MLNGEEEDCVSSEGDPEPQQKTDGDVDEYVDNFLFWTSILYINATNWQTFIL